MNLGREVLRSLRQPPTQPLTVEFPPQKIQPLSSLAPSLVSGEFLFKPIFALEFVDAGPERTFGLKRD